MIAHKTISGKKDSEQAEVASPSLSSGDELWRTDNKKKKKNCKMLRLQYLFINVLLFQSTLYVVNK